MRCSFRQPQDVAGMAIAVKTQDTYVAGPLEALPNADERELDRTAISIVEIGRNECVREQPVSRLLAETDDVERGALIEARPRAHGVNAADEAPEPLARCAILELGSAAAAVRVNGEAKFDERAE